MLFKLGVAMTFISLLTSLNSYGQDAFEVWKNKKPLKEQVENQISDSMNLLNGINVLKRLYSNNDDVLVKNVIQSILFFNKEMVMQQSFDIVGRIDSGEAIPVRFTSNEYFYRRREARKVTPTFKSKQEAIRFTKEDPLFHKETDIRICVDKDGNYYPKQAILQYTGHRVSWGQTSTITNYTIAHIWEKTDNPLYFGLLWNYCLIPAPFAFLTDKNDDSDAIVKRVKDLIKAISITLYNPRQLMKPHAVIGKETPSEEALDKARQLIQENKIQFVPQNNVQL
ncbi:MAG: hypothetical protein LBR26_10115 [Prevotella sp.]|jgi:hypothetical protein|nr:hypothetical protein [Prevotella sp.]